MQANRTKTVAAAVIGSILLAAGVLFQNKDKSFTHVDYMPQSAVHVVIASGHGSIIKGVYQTPGKQSPTWSDSLKIYEGFSCKILALDLCQKLMIAGIDVTYINNYNSDLTLSERCNKVNSMCNLDNRILFIEIHHNAQIATAGDYTDFEGLKGFTSTSSGGASGIEVYTSPGTTESDNFADNYLMPNLKGYLLDVKFRNNGKCPRPRLEIPPFFETKCNILGFLSRLAGKMLSLASLTGVFHAQSSCGG